MDEPQRSNAPNQALGQDTSASQEPSFIGQTRSLTPPTTNLILSPQDKQAPNTSSELLKPPADPGEFETYVEHILGRRLSRYGSDLLLPSKRDFAVPAMATIPPDYRVQPGDVIEIALAGSMDGSVKRTVDTNGKIFLDGVGAFKVAGVRNADLRDVVAAAVGTQYRGFTVTTTIAELRGIRVFVTGFANNPGAFSINGLSTMANAVLQAGGPSSGGSFRSVKLYRNGHEVADFDLYDLLRGGNRVADQVLENEDVLFIPPAGAQVAIFGSVQEEGIYEAKAGETIADLVRAAGGPNSLADRERLFVYHPGALGRDGPKSLSFQEARLEKALPGDMVQLPSTGSLAQPIGAKSILVRIEGEVARPGIYHVPPGTSLDAVVKEAGGLTSSAFVYGALFSRQSVKAQQREGYREALSQLELSLAAAPLTTDASQPSAERAAQWAGARAALDKLKQIEPDGRLILPLDLAARRLPGDIQVENNDSIYIPTRPSSAGVFGAVYRPASFLLPEGAAWRVADFIERAGGMTRAADARGVFVVRANGDVVSRRRGAKSAYVYPGDVVFVPVRTQGSSIWSKFKDISQTIFQFGLSAAAFVAVIK